MLVPHQMYQIPIFPQSEMQINNNFPYKCRRDNSKTHHRHKPTSGHLHTVYTCAPLLYFPKKHSVTYSNSSNTCQISSNLLLSHSILIQFQQKLYQIVPTPQGLLFRGICPSVHYESECNEESFFPSFQGQKN